MNDLLTREAQQVHMDIPDPAGLSAGTGPLAPSAPSDPTDPDRTGGGVESNSDPTPPPKGGARLEGRRLEKRGQKKAAGVKGRRGKRRRMPPATRFFLKLGVLGAICAVVFLFVLGVQINRGNGMYPFLMDGDLLITYKLDPYRVGDAVVYRRPDTGERAVARIAALGQNKILITDSGQLLINDYIPEERVFYPTQKAETDAISYPYQMDWNGVFVLNDFRSQTDDSRSFGALTREDLTGKVVYVFRRRGI